MIVVNKLSQVFIEIIWPGIRIAASMWGKITMIFFAVLVVSHALSTIPLTTGIVNAGAISILINLVFVLGIYFLNTNQEEMVDKCQTLMMLLGFVGTTLGMNEFLENFRPGDPNIEGLKYAFHTTAHGLLGTIVLYGIGFFSATKSIFDEVEDDDELSEVQGA